MNFTTVIPLIENPKYAIRVSSSTYVPFRSKMEDLCYFTIEKIREGSSDNEVFSGTADSNVFSKETGMIRKGNSVTIRSTYGELSKLVKRIVEAENYEYGCSKDS